MARIGRKIRATLTNWSWQLLGFAILMGANAACTHFLHVPFVPIFVGGGFIYGGFYFAFENTRASRSECSAVAHVVEHKKERRNRQAYYSPIVEFVGQDGQTQRRQIINGRGTQWPRIGKGVRVRYDPAHPKWCELDYRGQWFPPILCFSVGVGTLVLVLTKSLG